MPALICTSDGQGIKAEVDGKEQLFQFDRVFQAAASQQDVFNEVSELIQSALDGFQASLVQELFLFHLYGCIGGAGRKCVYETPAMVVS